MSRGLLDMVIAALCFSVMGVLVKFVGQSIPSNEVVFFRSVVGLILSVWMIRRHGLSPWGVNKPILILRGLLGFSGLLCFFYALTKLPLADAAVIMSTNPIWTAILAAVFLRERLSPRVLLASVAAFIGVTMVARPDFLFGEATSGTGLPLFAVAIALLGAVSAAGAYVCVRQLRRTDHALVVILFFPLIAAPGSIPTMWDNAVWPDAGQWLLLIAIGVVVQIAQVFLTRGLHSEPAGRATAVSYVQVVFAYLWGLLLFNEVPTPLSIGGAVLIVASAMWVALERAKRPVVADAS
ncbi:MAG: drug/metabolite transporter (DMT)-like permease [Myxococcota bacterium]|jgi:drug/metabolite transporter (DMT)-like permease